MSVSIGEVHTDVVPAGTPGAVGGAAGGAGPIQDLEEQLTEARCRQERRALRVAATGFDD